MTENIELKNYTSKTRKKPRSHDEERLIGNDHHFEEDELSSVHRKINRDYKFFVSSVSSHKHADKSEKKQKNTQKSISDIIESELAILESPITETIASTPIYNDTDFFVDKNKCYQGTENNIKLFNKMDVRIRNEENFRDWLDENGDFNFHATTLSPKPRLEPMLSNKLLQVAYVQPYMKENDSIIEEQPNNTEIILLDIEFACFRFEHHPLFSLEHMLSQCLKESYAEYADRKAKDTLHKLNDELKINRNAREKVKAELLKLNRSKQECHLDSTVVKYNQKIEKLKESYKNEFKRENDLISKIIWLWKDIKTVRKKMSSVNTSLVLEVFKESTSEEELTEVWNEKYNAEFMDALHNIEYIYAKQCLEYKNNKIDNKENLKKGRGYQKLAKPSLNFNEEEMKQNIEAKLKDLVPNDPKIDLNLKTDISMITTDVSDRQEIDRRKRIDNINYYFKVYVDDSIVCESKHFTLSRDFFADLSESFSVQILPSNKTITITLVENETSISKIKININDTDKYSMTQQYTFNTKEKVNADNYCTGSGNTLNDICKFLKLDLQSTKTLVKKIYTKGQLTLMTGWSNRDETNLSQLKRYNDTLKKLNNCLCLNKELDFDILSEIIYKVSDTPEELNENLRMLYDLQKLLDDKDYFLRDINEFVDDLELQEDKSRLKLLKYRNSGKFNSLKQTVIPLYPSQISTEQISYLNDESEFDNYCIPEEHASQMEPTDLRRYLGAKFIDALNAHTAQNLHENILKPTYENVVLDCQVWNIRTIFSKLCGQRLEPTRVPIMSKESSSLQNLHVSLHRAFCLPDRINRDASNPNPFHEEEEGFKVKQLRPFARVSYKDDQGQTTTAIGCNPTWNQTIHLSVRSSISSALNINLYDEVKEDSDDYDSEEPHPNRVFYRLNHRWLGSLQIPLSVFQSFSKIEGAFKINTPPVILGYQSSTDSKTNNSLLRSPYYPILTMQKDTAFMTLSISLSPQRCATANRKITNQRSPDEEFLFRHLTDFLINYAKEFPNRVVSLTCFGTGGRQKCVTQFLQPLPLPDLELLQKDQRVYTRRESAMSKSSSSSQARSGDGRSGGDERGDSANTPRSSELWSGDKEALDIRSTRKEGSQLDRVMHTCARYVSLIPVYEMSQTYHVTLMGWELLKILHGSPLDHAVLLASYFLYLGVKCWIICGVGLPRGSSSYVLIKYDLRTERILLTTDDPYLKSQRFYSMRRDTLVPFIYDAATGTRYDLKDACCPLKTVHYVYNDENIWINVQLVELCEFVRLDFTRISDWQPVFNRNISLSKLPQMSEQNLYSDPLTVDSLKRRLENKIKTKVQKWRSNRKTIWNRYCSSVLKDSLSHWEYWTFNMNTPKPGPNNRLKQLMSTYKIYGFPLNLTYTNMKRILSAIKSTALFLSDEPSVEFGLAVEIFSYPGAVLSVWIYLASITRN